MNSHTIALALLSVIAAFFGGMVLADYIGMQLGSIWGPAALGFVLIVVAFLIIEPIMRKASAAGYFPAADKNRSSVAASVFAFITAGAVGFLFLFDAKTRAVEQGIFDRPYIGGIWVGLALMGLVQAVKRRGLEKADE